MKNVLKTKKSLLLFFLQLICTISIIAQFGQAITIIDGPSSVSSTSFVADVDSDGDFDVVSKYNNSAYWFENDGEGGFSAYKNLMRFETVEDRQASVVDIDGDGFVDFLMGRYWKKGLGNGAFEIKKVILSKSWYLLGDMDSDGLMDVLYSASSKIYWQKNLGGGVFESGQVLINENLSLYRVFDINFDGVKDLIVKKDDIMYSYINLLEGNFDSISILDEIPSKFILKDFNTDGVMDMVAIFASAIRWYEIDATGTFALKQTISNHYGSGGVSLGDMDYDGKEDLFVGHTTEPFDRARYFHFDDGGLFDTTAISHSSYLNRYSNNTIVDLDGDGHNDIFNAEHSISKASWQKNISEGFFDGSKPIQRVFNKKSSISVLDIDGDQDDDIWSSSYSIMNLGNNEFNNVYEFYRPLGYQSVNKDLDGDNLADIAFPKGDSIYWKKNLGGNVFSESMKIDLYLSGCRAIGGSDFDYDGDIDLVAINYNYMLDGGLYFLRNDGLGNFTLEYTDVYLNNVSELRVEDVDQNGTVDIVIDNFYASNDGNANFEIINSVPDLFERPDVYRENQFQYIDIDGDGLRDYIASDARTSSTKTVWFKNLGNGEVSGAKLLLQKSHQGSVSSMHFVVFDANLDGVMDIVISHGYHRQLYYLEGLNSGEFKSPVVIYDAEGYGNLGGVRAVDVDQDGLKEIVFGEIFNNFDRIAYIGNLMPTKDTINWIYRSISCDDNGTPPDIVDDRMVLVLNIHGRTGTKGCKLILPNGVSANIDTLLYDVPTEIILSEGTASGDVVIVFEDLDDGSQFFWNAEKPEGCGIFTQVGDCSGALLLENKQDVYFYFLATENQFDDSLPNCEGAMEGYSSDGNLLTHWFTWTIHDSGTLYFTLSKELEFYDLDFILYKTEPGSDPCANKEAVRCMYSGGNVNNGVSDNMCSMETGLSPEEIDLFENGGCLGGDNSFVQQINAIAGEEYRLLVVDYFNVEGVNTFLQLCGTATIGVDDVPCFVLATDDLVEKESIIAFPNPTNDQLYLSRNHVQIDIDFSFQIIDHLGRVVASKNDNKRSSYIDTQNLQAGIYFIKINDGIERRILRFVKQ